jgi:hypothetical protein
MTNSFLFSSAYRAPACAALWAMLRHWRDSGQPMCHEARMPSFEDYAALVGSVCVAACLANPFAPFEWPMGGDEAGRALEDVLCALAAKSAHGQEWTSGDILQALSDAETLDLVLPHECRDERKALGKKLAKLRGMVLTTADGRRFEFGRRDAGSSARYPVRFLHSSE